MARVDKFGVPRYAILLTGIGMLIGISFSFVLPQSIYLFLVSSGGFALLFTYAVILVTHYFWRRRRGCPGNGCQLVEYPYTSFFGLVFLLPAMVSMPLIPGQAAGLFAGTGLVGTTVAGYIVWRQLHVVKKTSIQPALVVEISDELEPYVQNDDHKTTLEDG